MTLSIEARNPFLDYRLVEAGLSFGVSDLLHRGVTKWALREAMRDLLPSEIVDRATKQGFSSDGEIWMRGGLGDDLEEVFRSESFAQRPYFDPAQLLDLLDAHRAGTDHSEELWRAYSVERWLRLFVDPPTIAPPERAANAPTPVPLDPGAIVRLDESARALTA